MRLIDADELKKAFEKVYPLATNEMGGVVNKQIYEIIDNAPTVELDDELIVELTDQIIDLTDFLDSKNIFVWIDENGNIHECRSKEEREAEYKAAWLKYMIGEDKTNENND